MKNKLILTALVAIALTAGCKPTTSTETSAQQISKAQEATKDSAQQMRDFSYAQRTEFVAMMQTQLNDLNRSLDDISTSIDKGADNVRVANKAKLALLREQAAQLKAQLADITKATPDTWTAFKADVEKANASLKEGLVRSRTWLAEKIAP